MEDKNWLCLGLSCGGYSGKSIVKDFSSDSKEEEGSSSNLMDGDANVSDPSFKDFFQTGLENQDCNRQQKSERNPQHHENLWTDLGKCSPSVGEGSNNGHGNLSQLTRYQDLWVSSNKTIDKVEEKSGLNKRKLPFEDINLQKEHERVVDYIDTSGKKINGTIMKNSHFSVTTEDDSSGENEDVAERKAERTASWLISQHKNSSKSSDILKFTDKHVLTDPSGFGSQRKNHLCASENESNFEYGKLAYATPSPLQPATIMSACHSAPVKVPTAASPPNLSGFPSPSVMQLMPLANGERPMAPIMNSSNLQLAFGFSSVQFPKLVSDSSLAFGSQPQLAASFAGREHVRAPNSEHSENDVKKSHAVVQAPHSSLGALQHKGKSMDLVKGSGKYVEEAGTRRSSSQNEDESKGNSTTFRPKEATDQPVGKGEGSSIRLGMVSDVKFGGCGSHPDLPWVSTTGPGPNGKTISGVTYKFNKNQIKIVCACHGSHMSPEEFVQHASEDVTNPEK